MANLLRRSAVFAGVLAAAGLIFVLGVYGASAWKLSRTYDVPLKSPDQTLAPDASQGERMARIVGCWAGCHGVRGEGGVEEIPGIRRVTAPPLGAVIPHYSDAELFRLILYGVKRDGTSAVGMSSYTFWPLGDPDVANIIHFLRQQPPAEPVPRTREIPLISRFKLLAGDWQLSADQVDTSQTRWGNLPRETSFERGRFLAAIVCAECHGSSYEGDPLEGGPPLVIMQAYSDAEFARLMRTGTSRSGLPVEPMSWLPDVQFTDRDIADLYEFLKLQTQQ